MTTRRLVRLESLDGAIVVSFPARGYAWQSDPGTDAVLERVAGAAYAFDHGSAAEVVPGPSSERVAFGILGSSESDAEAKLSELISKCRRVGRGWLYRQDSTGVERRALARLSAIPRFTRAAGSQLWVPVVLEFQRLSDWQSVVPTTGSQVVASSPTNFSITNPGDLPCYAVVFRLRSNGTTTVAPKIENLTNGWWLQSARTMSSANDEVRVDSGLWLWQWSTNDGASYSADWGNATIGASQRGIMRLEPGNNSMRATVTSGTPAFTVEWEFFARYA